MHHQMNAQMQECVDRCQNCQQVCLETITHCLQQGGRHAAADHIRLLVTCADICGTSARFMSLGSPHHNRVCGVCAEVCDACGAECEAFDDEAMKQCAEACRRCAESCRQMAAAEMRA